MSFSCDWLDQIRQIFSQGLLGWIWPNICEVWLNLVLIVVVLVDFWMRLNRPNFCYDRVYKVLVVVILAKFARFFARVDSTKFWSEPTRTSFNHGGPYLFLAMVILAELNKFFIRTDSSEFRRISIRTDSVDVQLWMFRLNSVKFWCRPFSTFWHIWFISTFGLNGIISTVGQKQLISTFGLTKPVSNSCQPFLTFDHC